MARRPLGQPGSFATALVLVWAFASTGCGFGTASAVAAASGEGTSNAPPTISGFGVTHTSSEPARIRLVLSDREGDSTQVEFLYRVDGGAARRMTSLPGLTANPATLGASFAGTIHEFDWHFTLEEGIPDDGSLSTPVDVWTRVSGGSQIAVEGANAVIGVRLGNDAPVTTVSTPPGESSGIVPISFSVSDTSAETVSVRVEFDVQSDVPDLGWRPARPAGLALGAPTPDVAIRDLLAPAEGTAQIFFWDTDHDGGAGAGLHDLERDVVVRVAAADAIAEGAVALTRAFRVDNNAAPIAIVNDGLLLVDSDDRRGLVVPFTVVDDEGDVVRMVFQWRRPGETFPDLPEGTVELDELLDDPVRRRASNVCSESVRAAHGHLLPVDASTVELPELASGVDVDLDGAELEILRSSSLSAASDAWHEDVLASPVGIVALGNGPEVVVLDEPAPGTWRLLELDLATGDAEDGRPPRTIASGSGVPSALATEADGDALLLAIHVGGSWTVHRVRIADGATSVVGAFDGATPPGAIRGIASVGPGRAVVTVADALVLLDGNGTGAPRSSVVVSGLALPWGVQSDPIQRDRVIVAESGASPGNPNGRLVQVALSSGQVDELPVSQLPLDPPFARPRSIALSRGGMRVVALCETNVGTGVVDLIQLERAGEDATRPLVRAHDLAGGSVGLASGSDDLVVLVQTGSDGVLVAGGVEQRRQIVAIDTATRRVTLDRPLEPLPAGSRPWRARPRVETRGSPTGTRASFLWDSGEVVGGGPVLVRATPIDTEFGIAGESLAPKTLRSELDGDVVELVTAGLGITDPIVADVDADGHVDVVAAAFGDDRLAVLWQIGSGEFDGTPTVLGSSAVLDAPTKVIAADIDGDGRIDVASANRGSDDITVFWQEAPRAFAASPTVLGGPSVTDGAEVVAVADVDGDGRLDLVSVNRHEDSLTIFRQIAPRSFAPTPTVVGSTAIDAPFDLLVRDVDGDGRHDLVCTSHADRIAVFLQSAAGNFPAQPLELTVPGLSSVSDGLAAGDLDSDGDVDLACSALGSGVVAIFRQSAAGEFAETPIVLDGDDLTASPEDVELADVDGDRDLDVLVLAGAGHVAVFEQRGPGDFVASPLRLGTGTLFLPFDVHVADIDEDGRPDLVASSLFDDSSKLVVMQQRALLRFAEDPVVVPGTVNDGTPVRSVQVADVDGDASTDLIAVQGNAVSVFWRSAAGDYGPPLLVLGGGPGAAPEGSPIDLDGDGRLDLVFHGGPGGELLVAWQQSPRDFLPFEGPFGGPGSRIVDIDRDGDLDLVWESGSTVSVVRQTSPRLFAAPAALLSGPIVGDPRSLAVGDVDGDSRPEIALGYEDGRIHVFVQEAAGGYGSPPLVIPSMFISLAPGDLQIADVDGDGRADLCGINAFLGYPFVHWQGSGLTFETMALPPTVGSSDGVDLELADLDGDGDLDVALASAFENTLAVFEQLAPRRFSSAPILVGGPTVTSNPRGLAVADVDRDGDLDLVSSNEDSNTLTIFHGAR